MFLPRRDFLRSVSATFLLGRSGDEPGRPDPPGDGDEAILAALRPLHEMCGAPGLTAAIVRTDRPTRVAAVGLRKAGSPEGFRATDLVHLGSCTKAMTATMIATVVEAGSLAWDRTLDEAFPDLEINAGYRSVTLAQLLTHRAGLPADGDWRSLGAEKSPTEQRRELARRVLGKPPESSPGKATAYSNVGYALAGLMAEETARTPWEDLMRDRLFRPLGMTSAGFGAPGTPGGVDQPWGHSRIVALSIPSQADNPPALGPAGTVHCSLADWGRFVALHLRGARGDQTPILKPESFRALHDPAPGEEYAKGWIALERDWGGGRVLVHNGSNTRWYALAWLAPKKGMAFLAVANEYDKTIEKACDRAIMAMVGMTEARPD